MAAAKYNIIIEQGATYSEGVRVYYNNGLPYDLTGYTPRMQLRGRKFGLLTLDMLGVNYFKYLDLVNGYFATYISAVETRELPAGVYDYDLELSKDSDVNTVIRLLEGQATVRGEVTR